jgi:uncharacterized damage-inducible protein DinB
MSTALLELYRHSTRATLSLIRYCQGLAAEDLDATTPGTYGTVRATLRHLVEEDEGLVTDLTGERSEPLPDDPLALDALAARIERLGPRRAQFARDLELREREIVTRDGRWRVPGAVPLAEVINHAGEHRTHVLSILGANGHEELRLNVWRHAIATGAIREVAPAADRTRDRRRSSPGGPPAPADHVRRRAEQQPHGRDDCRPSCAPSASVAGTADDG